MIKVEADVKPRDPKGEGGYEDVIISKYIGGTNTCMKRLAIDTNGCSQLTPNKN